MATKKHTDKGYAAQLEELRERLISMAGLVEEMIDDAIEALVEQDVHLARRTIEADNAVNRAEIETDELCMVILATRQPMASDLRFITIALKMVTDLERIGDLAVNICERAIDLANEPLLKPWEDVPHMADVACSMVRDAIGAFIDGDTGAAREIIERDREVDVLYTEVFREVLAIMVDDPHAIARGIHIQSVAKWIERIADHATNLAEQVIFMVKGKDIRHPQT